MALLLRRVLVQAMRGMYRELYQEYMMKEGQLASARAVLEYEEAHLTKGLDEAVAALRSGKLLLSMRARKDLVEDIVRGSTMLLKLNREDVEKLRETLKEAAFESTVGDALGQAKAFQHITVAELGQRRAEAAWHPDLVLMPELPQSHMEQHLREVGAQAKVDFVKRAKAIQHLRVRVMVLAANVR